jgi:predicted nuclease of restriction endonuclease-like (RecB) superfamily
MKQHTIQIRFYERKARAARRLVRTLERRMSQLLQEQETLKKAAEERMVATNKAADERMMAIYPFTIKSPIVIDLLREVAYGDPFKVTPT